MLCLATLVVCKYETILKYTSWFGYNLIKEKEIFMLFICFTSLYNLYGNI